MVRETDVRSPEKDAKGGIDLGTVKSHEINAIDLETDVTDLEIGVKGPMIGGIALEIRVKNVEMIKA